MHVGSKRQIRYFVNISNFKKYVFFNFMSWPIPSSGWQWLTIMYVYNVYVYHVYSWDGSTINIH